MKALDLNWKSKLALAVGLLALTGTSCLSMQSQSTLDGIQGATSTAPFVEAYIEYPGPQAKWAGPATFTMHVTAKDAGGAQIAVAPALFGSGRTVASEGKGMTGEAARGQMGHLAQALQGASGGNFRGCMYPVRVRLIRADGALMEKQGCRGQDGWSKSASEAVHNFITAAVER